MLKDGKVEVIVVTGPQIIPSKKKSGRLDIAFIGRICEEKHLENRKLIPVILGCDFCPPISQIVPVWEVSQEDGEDGGDPDYVYFGN